MSKAELPLTSERSNNDDNNMGGEGLAEIVKDEEHVPLNRDSATLSNDESDSNYSLMSDGMNNKTSQTTNIFDSTSIETATDSQRAIEMAIGPRKEGLAYHKEFLLRTSPITGTVLLLILTRIPQIGLNELLKKTSPHFSIYFGTYGIFGCLRRLCFNLRKF